MKRLGLFFSFVLFNAGLAVLHSPAAEEGLHTFKAMGAPAHPKVEVPWNRYNDTEGLFHILKQLQEAYPNLTQLYSIGMTQQGRNIWCLEVTDRKTGDPSHKPGMYIDGNIHGNEIQAGEVVAYTAWYLCEMHGQLEKVDQLLDKFVFYLIPTINPDGRDSWFHEANTMHSSRSGQVPYDDDHDGVADEDGPDDLDGNGSITLMRIRDPNGRWNKDPEYPNLLMVRAADDEPGEYTILGDEGIDNDGDGRINEDPVGGYDPNRNWSWDWQPWYVQYGAIDFPFSLPNTRSVAQFTIAHPNIAAGQTYHNYSGLILRGPGREGGEMSFRDDRVMASIGAKGETMLPFYRSIVTWSGLYGVWGSEFDWFYGARGILMFSNELWTPQNMFRDNRTGDRDEAEFIKYLLLDEAIVEWKEYDHPTYGKIEIGGTKKEFGRVPPSFLLEEECHRNMMFTLYHASQMPQIAFGEIQDATIGDSLHKIQVEIKNGGMIPTRTGQDVQHSISRPDLVMFQGDGIDVISSGIVTDRYFNKVEPVLTRPARVELDTIPGMDSVRLQFIVSGKGNATLSVDSLKGGILRKEMKLN